MYSTIQEAMNQKKGFFKIRGWVYRERQSNKFIFLVLRDETNILQCIIEKELVPHIFEKAKGIRIESSIEVHGELKEDSRAPTGFEMQVKDIVVYQKIDNYPISKDLGTEFLLDQRHLWIRSQ